MATNTLTGQQLLDGVSEFMEDVWSGTTTSAGATDGTTLVDTALAAFGRDAMVDGFILLTSGSASGEIIKVNANTAAGTVTLDEGASAQIASGVTYQFHRWDPNMKLRALDRARIHGLKYGLGQVIYNETLTGDGETREFDLPAALRQGPFIVFEEDPISADSDWNILVNPEMKTTTSWTASAGTLSTYSEDQNDLLIPKYDDACLKLAVPTATAASLSQSDSDWVTPAIGLLQGRRVTFGVWVYCLTASRVTAKVDDASASSSSAAHGGAGWEFLEVTHDVDEAAASLTVSVEVSNDTGAVTLFANRAWLMFGETIPSPYAIELNLFGTRRDGSTQRVIFQTPPTKKRQLRVIGRGLLTALDGSLTATMEVEEVAAELLYAITVRVMLGSLGLSSDNHKSMLEKIQAVEREMRDLLGEAEHLVEREPVMRGPHY